MCKVDNHTAARMCKADEMSKIQPGDKKPKIESVESGDGWVFDDSGTRYWGLFGAAGLVAFDPQKGVLLQHRVEWSHHGGTWGVPGGARHKSETAVDAALRESREEAAVPPDALTVLFEHRFELGFWSYTTVVASVHASFDARVTDPESNELRWVPLDQVEALPLHPGFAGSWPEIRAQLTQMLEALGEEYHQGNNAV